MKSFELTQIIHFIKKKLKSKGFTYRDLSNYLSVSEVTVKRMMAKGEFTVQRLEKIAALFGMDIFEFLQKAKNFKDDFYRFTDKQEMLFYKEPLSFYIAILLSTGFSLENVRERLDLPIQEFDRLLFALDGHGIIEVWDNYRIRLTYRSPSEINPAGIFYKKVNPELLKKIIQKIMSNSSEDFVSRGEVYMTLKLRKQMLEEYGELEKKYYMLARLEQDGTVEEALVPVVTLFFSSKFDAWKATVESFSKNGEA